ncbi:hypothetical protein WICMUC_001999 [Wickerhamomyces mucosus]|uniref:Ubiquitination network signaling protein n=1 Tax=Wickerhamomyces mucosus TaxID=1378264 RepID=A0A9P8TEA3_9ASCO|nr:hypothetical protein WICMUC_001999 [Wickerhamomyces mucosus]
MPLLLPQDALLDSTAILVILLNIPPIFSIFVQFLYIQTSSSKQIVSRMLFKTSKPNNIPKNNNNSSHIANNNSILNNTDDSSNNGIKNSTLNNQQSEESESILIPMILISIFDFSLTLLIRILTPNLSKLILLFSNSIIAISLTGFDYYNSILASLSIISLDYCFKFFISYLSKNFQFVTLNNYHIFPYLSTSSNHLTYDKLFFNFINLFFAIHILLMTFSTVFKKNFISKNIQQLSNPQDDIILPINTTTHDSLLDIQLTSEISNSIIPGIDSFTEEKDKVDHINHDGEPDNTSVFSSNTENYDNDNNNINENNVNENNPASYPSSKKTFINPASSSNIVSENFNVFLNSSFMKSKNSAKASQPLWSLIGTVKAMNLRKDIYSGETNLDYNQREDALILSENFNYIKLNESDERRIGTVFLRYIGETLVAVQLSKNFKFNNSNSSIIIKVNGIIWYQVSRSLINDHEEIFIISGLTPLSHYDIQFILNVKNEQNYLIDELIIGTIDSDGKNCEIHNSNSEKNNPEILSSPLVTLQESLITTNENLNKEKFKLKKTRKEIGKKLNSIKSDIELFKKRINNNDKNDEKNWKKILILRNNVKSLEGDIHKIDLEYNELESKELEINEIYLVEKRKFDSSLRNFQNFKNQFTSKIEEKQEVLKKLNSEIESLQAKDLKTSSKLSKLISDNEKNTEEIDEILKNDQDQRLKLRFNRNEKRKFLLNEFKKEISNLQKGLTYLSNENDTLKKIEQQQQQQQQQSQQEPPQHPSSTSSSSTS